MAIPFFKQITKDTCGPAALQMALAAHGMRVSQRLLTKQAKTPTHQNFGTTTKNMMLVLKQYKILATAKNRNGLKDIIKALGERKIIIVCYSERETNAGHYALLTKVGKKFVTLLDPAYKNGTVPKLSIEEFILRWKDRRYTKTLRWAAFVQSPDRGKSVR